jgi:hypothetical protein
VEIGQSTAPQQHAQPVVREAVTNLPQHQTAAIQPHLYQEQLDLDL